MGLSSQVKPEVVAVVEPAANLTRRSSCDRAHRGDRSVHARMPQVCVIAGGLRLIRGDQLERAVCRWVRSTLDPALHQKFDEFVPATRDAGVDVPGPKYCPWCWTPLRH